MGNDCVFVLSVPGLLPRDVDRTATPTLWSWCNAGLLAPMTPTFPCVTSPVQASMVTGTTPEKHGIIANGFYDRRRREVEFWVGWNDKIAGRQIWDDLHDRTPRVLSAVWHAQNIKGAAADFIVTPAPIHEPDGSTKLWCYSKPDGTYQKLVDSLGHFPLQHYWGPMSNIQSTRWILNAAAWLHEKESPQLQWVYIPHLDYAGQKFGPDSDQAKAAVAELDRELASWVEKLDSTKGHSRLKFLVVGEYAMTSVDQPVFLNRVLREEGWLVVRGEDDGEVIDFERSECFAMVDHQFAHVYVRRESVPLIPKICDRLRAVPGVETVLAGPDRAKLGVNHERSGDVVVVSDERSWFAYYWWLDDAAAPRFARTVDIHRKPGYDPVELFFDPVAKGIPLNAGLVKGSHGVPVTGDQHRTVLISSTPLKLVAKGGWRDTDVRSVVKELISE